MRLVAIADGLPSRIYKFGPSGLNSIVIGGQVVHLNDQLGDEPVAIFSDIIEQWTLSDRLNEGKPGAAGIYETHFHAARTLVAPAIERENLGDAT